jgi:hypothetical protein
MAGSIADFKKRIADTKKRLAAGENSSSNNSSSSGSSSSSKSRQDQQKPRTRKFNLARAMMSENSVRIAGHDFISENQRRCANSMNRTGSFISSLSF